MLSLQSYLSHATNRGRREEDHCISWIQSGEHSHFERYRRKEFNIMGITPYTIVEAGEKVYGYCFYVW